MKRVAALLLAAVIVAASSTSADALNMVTAEATLDGTEFRFTTTGTLVVSGTENGMVHAFGSAPTTPTTNTGSAIAHASIDNGFLAATAGAATTGEGGLPNAGQASAVVLASITLFGTGTGSVVVAVPYQLSLVSVETDERDLTSAEANVSFEIGPGVSARGDARDAIDLNGAGSISRDGILTASREFSNPTWGPLVSFSGTAQVSVTSALPEDTSSLLLLTVGLLVLAALLYTRFRASDGVSQ
jgi:hypothetical protein